jgi:hypothetical protein
MRIFFKTTNLSFSIEGRQAAAIKEFRKFLNKLPELQKRVYPLQTLDSEPSVPKPVGPIPKIK